MNTRTNFTSQKIKSPIFLHITATGSSFDRTRQSYKRSLSNFTISTTKKTTKSFKKWTTKSIKNLTELKFNYKTPCKITSKSQLTFHFFELNLLLFHLSILSCSSFIQLYFYSKLAMMLIGILVYIIGFNMQQIYECLGQNLTINQSFLKAELLIQMIFYVIFLHLIDRRVCCIYLIRILKAIVNFNHLDRSKF